MARRRGRGFARQVRRKFVWDRTFGTVAVGPGGPYGVDLLANFRAQPGATHLGASVMRIRGYVHPTADAGTNPNIGGTIGFRIDSWNEDVATDPALTPAAQPDEDWMGWLPFQGTTFEANTVPATWNSEASPWAVDIKAARKLEELNQTLWMFLDAPTTGTVTYNYNLSVGLKLA